MLFYERKATRLRATSTVTDPRVIALAGCLTKECHFRSFPSSFKLIVSPQNDTLQKKRRNHAWTIKKKSKIGAKIFFTKLLAHRKMCRSHNSTNFNNLATAYSAATSQLYIPFFKAYHFVQ